MAERGRNLNPHHPGWNWFGHVFDAYRRRDYRGSLAICQEVNMPAYWRTQCALAAAYGQLGERESAHKGVRVLLAVRPDFAARRELSAPGGGSRICSKILEGLRQAGLEVASDPGSAPTKPAAEARS